MTDVFNNSSSQSQPVSGAVVGSEPAAANEYLLLKWGTLKGWDFKNDDTLAAARRYAEGGMSAGAMSQDDTPEQKQALCDLIDAVNGPITNDWTGEQMTKAEAKEYVLSYGAAKAVSK